jgi:hypothetical protein
MPNIRASLGCLPAGEYFASRRARSAVRSCAIELAPSSAAIASRLQRSRARASSKMGSEPTLSPNGIRLLVMPRLALLEKRRRRPLSLSEKCQVSARGCRIPRCPPCCGSIENRGSDGRGRLIATLAFEEQRPCRSRRQADQHVGGRMRYARRTSPLFGGALSLPPMTTLRVGIALADVPRRLRGDSARLGGLCTPTGYF